MMGCVGKTYLIPDPRLLSKYRGTQEDRKENEWKVKAFHGFSGV
jgi:hypothetical protein